jgi:DNA-binding MarR family transcriptional regulator
MATPPVAVDLSSAADRDVAVRIGLAWREMRRGASTVALRDYMFGNADDALDAGQMDSLDVLAFRPFWRMSELADALRVDPSTATRAVQRLVKDGLAERRADLDDGRVVMVSITEKGRLQHQDIDRRRGRVIRRLMGAFTPQERADFAELLSRFVKQLDVVVDDMPTATD